LFWEITMKMAIPVLKIPLGQKNAIKRDLSFPEHVVPVTKTTFPRVYQKLILLWGTKDFAEYMNSLSTVPGDRVVREGFPMKVMTELSKLHTEHHRTFPHLHKYDPWDVAFLES